jgi:hypothetical protein
MAQIPNLCVLEFEVIAPQGLQAIQPTVLDLLLSLLTDC